MRIFGLVFALLATLSLSAAAQASVQGYTRQERTYAPGHGRSSPDRGPSNTYSYPGNTNPDTARTAAGNPDPYLQRYYSESEGWTYYTLPPDSSARKSEDE